VAGSVTVKESEVCKEGVNGEHLKLVGAVMIIEQDTLKLGIKPHHGTY
jgi:hypothetical protein